MERDGDSVQRRRRSSKQRFRVCQVLLRILASIFTLSATLIFALNKQTADFAGYPLQANYKLSPVFKFFIAGNAVGCGYSLLSLPFVSNLFDGCLLCLLDLMNNTLLMAAVSAMTAIAYLAKKGNNDIGWSEVCPYFERFCRRVEISIAFSYGGLLLFLLICALNSWYRTASKASN